MHYHSIIGLVAFALPALSTYAAAQTGPSVWLFQCTLNNGANSLGVHVYDDRITYSYANSVGQLELNLNDTVADVQHVLALWDDPNFNESVTFYNGDTSYEVFSEAPKTPVIGAKAILDGGPVDGGVVVSAPDGTRTELLCDANTIEPNNPLARFARLASFKDENYDMYNECLAAYVGSEACAEYRQNQCYVLANDAIDPSDCLPELLTWSLFELDATYQLAVTMSQNHGGDLDALKAAQEIWETSRTADCEIGAWTAYNVMDGDVGLLQCNLDYNIKRIGFLRNHAAGLEFDG